MSEPWWSRFIELAIGFVLSSMVVGWMAKSRLKRRPQTRADARQIAHTPAFLAVGLISFALFAGAAGLSHFSGNETASWWTTLLFLGFASLGLLMLLEYARGRHELVYGGLNYGRAFRSDGRLKWSEVSRVRYNSWIQWFKLETGSGRVARVSGYVSGLPAFAAAILENVSPEAMDAATRKVLEETASGKPPRVW